MVQELVCTEGELAACGSRGDRIQALAARFAAKEACLKALGAATTLSLETRSSGTW